MIQPEQFLTSSLEAHPHGRDVASILAAAIQAVDPYQASRRHLNMVDDQLYIGGRTISLGKPGRVFLVGAGKAGLPMAQAVMDVLGSQVDDGLVIVKEGYGAPQKIGVVKIREAGHPVPNQHSIVATQEMLSLLANTAPGDLVIAVISGGGSALMTAPVKGVSLAELQKLTAMLLDCGADIREINQIRRRLDQVKGGGLARSAAPASLAALILSDVVGDPLELIASGPTVLSPGSWQEIGAILQKYHLGDQISEPLRAILNQPHQLPFVPREPQNILIGNNQLAAEAAVRMAQQMGYQTKLLTTALAGAARDVGREYGRMLKMLAEDQPKQPVMWLAGGETSVTVRGGGMGGRNQELALAAVPEIAGVPGVLLVTLATDGGDGLTDAAGAAVTGNTMQRALAARLDPVKYLDENNSHNFFRQLGDCLMTGPTHTNVNDLVFLFCWNSFSLPL